MDKIQLKDKKFKLFIPQESIAKAVVQWPGKSTMTSNSTKIRTFCLFVS